MTSEEYWRRLGECGWLDAVGEQERQRLGQALPEALAQDPDTAYEALACFVFDTETIEAFGPGKGLASYGGIIEAYAARSLGQLAPEDIVDAYDEAHGQVRVGFTHGGRRFELSVPHAGEWFDPAVHELVNEAIREAGGTHQFLPLPVVDQCFHLAFVPPEVYERAVEAGLIPREVPLDEFMGEERDAG